MKLRNKKTGEIVTADLIYTNVDNCVSSNYSLAELNEEWEDYEDTKDHWHIGCEGDVFIDNTESCLKSYYSLGNDFETKEEAGKAVEKLKAWKRLKDKGFDFESWENNIGDDYYKTGQIVINLNNVKNRDWDEYDNIGEIKEELDLLFGVEDD